MAKEGKYGPLVHIVYGYSIQRTVLTPIYNCAVVDILPSSVLPGGPTNVRVILRT